MTHAHTHAQNQPNPQVRAGAVKASVDAAVWQAARAALTSAPYVGAGAPPVVSALAVARRAGLIDAGPSVPTGAAGSTA